MLLPDSKVEIVHRGNKTVYDLGGQDRQGVQREQARLRHLQRGAEPRAPSTRPVSAAPAPWRSHSLDNGGWALITSKVPGVTLAEKMQAEPQRFGEYLEQFVDLQIEINGYTCTQLNRQFDKYTRMINSLDQINATTRYNLLERLNGLKSKGYVCHGDFNPSNVIVGEDGELYVCDWAHATQAPPPPTRP